MSKKSTVWDRGRFPEDKGTYLLSYLAQHNGILNAAPRGRMPSGCFGAAEGDSLSHPAGRDMPDDSSLGEGAKGDTSSVIRLAGIGG